jgi:hypothetical protein
MLEVLALTDAELARRRAVFDAITSLAGARLAEGSNAESAALCQLAGHYAWANHAGMFTSPPCESLLRSLGARTPVHERRFPTRIEHVLHVLTRAAEIGGHTRVVDRWMQLDSRRRHSIAVTSPFAVPEFLSHSVRGRGGSVISLTAKGDSLVERARQLLELSRGFDAILLHTHPFDVVPCIARLPEASVPVALLNHAEHVFWFGVSASELFVNLRDSAAALSVQRRGITPERNCLVPIPLAHQERAMSREDAKHALGIDLRHTVIMMMASPYKYEPTARSEYLEACAEALREAPHAVLVSIGPRDEGAWATLKKRSGGRVHPVGPVPFPGRYLDAADIFLDSFPFSSNTSLLEAGVRGSPILCYRPARQDAAVLSADAPGLDDHLIRAVTCADFVAQVTRLADSPALRARIGSDQRDAILARHTGQGWLDCCDALYARLVALTDQERQPWATEDWPPEPAPGALDEALANLDSTEPKSLVELALYQRKYLGTSTFPSRTRTTTTAPEPLSFTSPSLTQASMTDLVIGDLQIANLRARTSIADRNRLLQRLRARLSRGLSRMSPKWSARLRTLRARTSRR